MRSTFSGIEIAKRSLFTHQAALTTTGHNISNANTRGYSRQVVNMVASRPMEAVGLMRSNVPGQIGTGVEFDYIKRVREGFLDKQFRHENQAYGDWDVRKNTLDKLEAVFNEPSDTGIRQTIENFWNAWHDVSKEPDNLTARAALKEKTLAMTDAFNHTASQLKHLNSDLTDNIGVKVNEVNTYLDNIAQLNVEIFRVEGLGNDANDLRDQRDLILDDLAKIINIDAVETESGYTVSMGGTQLVSFGDVQTVFTPDTIEAAFGADLTGGEIYGLIYSRDVFVSDYRTQLDAFAQIIANGSATITLPSGTVLPEGTQLNGVTYSGASRTLTSDLQVTVEGINGLHRLGYTLQHPVQAGGDFFTMKSGATELNAETITLNPDIILNLRNIATSMRTYNDSGVERVVQGNGELGLQLAGLRNVSFNFDPNNTGTRILTDGTFDEFYRALIGQLGVQSQEAGRQTINQKILVDQVDSKKQSVSGVSLDEEMANMIKFQHAYNAAARAMTSYDEILDKVINGMGVVGR